MKILKAEAHEMKAKNINPYLVDAKDILVDKQKNSNLQCSQNEFIGSMPTDGGNFIYYEEEKNELYKKRTRIGRKIYQDHIINVLNEFFKTFMNIRLLCLWLSKRKYLMRLKKTRTCNRTS
jgi:predicted small secreted protein